MSAQPQVVTGGFLRRGGECFDRSPFFHDVTLYDLNAKYATVVNVAETIEYLRPFAAAAA